MNPRVKVTRVMRSRRKPPFSPWNWLTLGMVALSLFLSYDLLEKRWAARNVKSERTALNDKARKKAGAPSVSALPTKSDPRLFALAGRMDVLNRYQSTVLIRVRFSEEERGTCSGTIIGRRLVLTAGHCVCQRRRISSEQGGTRSIIDGSACMETVILDTKVYEPVPIMVEEVPARYGTFQGTVRPHPELRILLDEQGQVVSSHADLAVIHLDEDFEEEFRPIPLADRDIRLNETVVIVGSGYDELSRQSDGERRSSRNKVTEVLSSGGGRMRIEQPEGHHYRGDSGGPCLREGTGRAVLVGISSRNLGEGEAITSTYGYRDWLREELRRAEPAEPLTDRVQ